jgi:hypothetical protein
MLNSYTRTTKTSYVAIYKHSVYGTVFVYSDSGKDKL